MRSIGSSSGKPYEIAVVGSVNVDLHFHLPRTPAPGETIKAKSFSTSIGGKGANQAVACARLTHCKPFQGLDKSNRNFRIYMNASVGDDTHGQEAITTLGDNYVDTFGVTKITNEPTGTAVIQVDRGTGENSIILNPGANNIWPHGQPFQLKRASVALFQLEIPLSSVYLNLATARGRGMQTILNPAPAQHLSCDFVKHVDHLIMNETEACILAGKPPSELSYKDCHDIIDIFLAEVQHVVITVGSRGVHCKSRKGKPFSTEALKVNAQDTTGAGDTFVGAYAAVLAHSIGTGKKFDLEATVRFASCAAALSVTKYGGMESIPWAEEVAMFARDHGIADELWNWNPCFDDTCFPPNYY